MRKIRTRRLLSAPLRAPARGLKRLTAMRFPDWSSRAWFIPGSSRRWHREVGDGTANSAVAATLAWIARTFPEAPIAMWELLGGGEEEMLDDHPLVDLLHFPNDFYAGETLWTALLFDYHVDGNAYLLKIRTTAGAPAELWWIPEQMIEPRGDRNTFISHYDYTPGGTSAPIRLDPGDVVHFRNGVDPDNQRKGRSPMRSVLSEVFTDEEAATYTATILRNMGVPGVIVSPKESQPGSGSVPPEDVQATKQYLRSQFTGDNRGEPLVLGDPVDVVPFGFSPEQMDLRSIRRLPEERITAMLGVPAIVVGLGAGLERSTFANYAEAREAAYESRIIPDQRILAAELRRQLLPDFEPDARRFRVGFDLTSVRVLQPDEDKLHERARENFKAGLWTRARALRSVGDDASPDDEVYMVPIATELLPAKAAGAADLQAELDKPAPVPPPAPAALPPAHDPAANGNGKVPPELVPAAT